MDVKIMNPKLTLIMGPILLIWLLTANQAPAADQAENEQHASASFNWFAMVKPLGIATLSVLCLTFLAGLFRRKLGRRFRKLHIALAITSVSLGLCHGILVFILFG
jgi:hypothetical protein